MCGRAALKAKASSLYKRCNMNKGCRSLQLAFVSVIYEAADVDPGQLSLLIGRGQKSESAADDYGLTTCTSLSHVQASKLIHACISSLGIQVKLSTASLLCKRRSRFAHFDKDPAVHKWCSGCNANRLLQFCGATKDDKTHTGHIGQN